MAKMKRLPGLVLTVKKNFGCPRYKTFPEMDSKYRVAVVSAFGGNTVR